MHRFSPCRNYFQTLITQIESKFKIYFHLLLNWLNFLGVTHKWRRAILNNLWTPSPPPPLSRILLQRPLYFFLQNPLPYPSSYDCDVIYGQPRHPSIDVIFIPPVTSSSLSILNKSFFFFRNYAKLLSFQTSSNYFSSEKLLRKKTVFEEDSKNRFKQQFQ